MKKTLFINTDLLCRINSRGSMCQIKIFLFYIMAIGIFLIIPYKSAAQWVRCAGPEGGNITCLALKGSMVFAGTVGGGVFKSVDSGANWVPVNTGLQNTFVRAIAVNGDYVYVGTDDRAYLSSNNGDSWSILATRIPLDRPVYSIAARDSIVFADIFRSKDLCKTWDYRPNGLYQPRCFLMTANKIYAGYYANNGGGVTRTSYTDTVWTPINSGLKTTHYVTSLAMFNNVLFAGANDSGVFRSTDSGTSWSAFNSGLTNKKVYCLAADDTILLAGTNGGGVFRLAKGSTQWVAVNTGLTSLNIVSLTAKSGLVFAGTSDAGVFRSLNGGTNWIAVNKGMSNTNIYSLLAKDSVLFAGTDYGLYTSKNNGATWDRATTVPLFSVNALIARDTAVYAGVGNANGIFRSQDKGKTWISISTGQSVYALALLGRQIVVGTHGGGVFLSDSNGTVWTAINNGLGSYDIDALATIGNNIFIGAELWQFYRSRKTDTGWVAQLDTIFRGTNFNVYSLLTTGQQVLAGTNDRLYSSNDTGKTWINISKGLSISATTVVTALAEGKHGIYTGTNMGPFVSTNSGAQWTRLNSGFPLATNVLSLAEDGNNLFAGTKGAGVWRLPIGLVGIKNQSNDPLKQFDFMVKSPNSICRFLSLKFTLSKTEKIQTKMYDLKGHQVAILTDKSFGSGTHSIVWNTDKLQSGCYVIRMSVGSSCLNKSFLMIR